MALWLIMAFPFQIKANMNMDGQEIFQVSRELEMNMSKFN